MGVTAAQSEEVVERGVIPDPEEMTIAQDQKKIRNPKLVVCARGRIRDFKRWNAAKDPGMQVRLGGRHRNTDPRFRCGVVLKVEQRGGQFWFAGHAR